MSMSEAMRQMPASAGRAGAARGQAEREAASDEAEGPRHEPGDTGNPHAAFLHAAFTRELGIVRVLPANLHEMTPHSR